MPAPLPSALRARFEEYIAEGFSGRAAAARLKLSAATGVRWKRKLHETGAIEPAPRGRPAVQLYNHEQETPGNADVGKDGILCSRPRQPTSGRKRS